MAVIFVVQIQTCVAALNQCSSTWGLVDLEAPEVANPSEPHHGLTI